MITETVTTKLKDGTERAGTIVIPENLGEAVKTLGESTTFKYFKKAYRSDQLLRIRYNRQKRVPKLVIRPEKLTPQQRDLLKKAGLLKAEE